MDDRGSAQPHAPRARQVKARMSWLVLCLVATAALSLVAVQVPPVAKKLGLFAIAYGLVAGGIAAWLTTALDLKQPRIWRWAPFVFCLVLAGQIGMALESHRLQREAARKALLSDPKRAMLVQLQEAAQASGDAEAQKEAAQMWRTVGGSGPSFRDYLEYRVSALGRRAEQWAAAIWIIEMLLGSVAGAWSFRWLALRSSGAQKSATQPNLPALPKTASGHPTTEISPGLDGGVAPAKLEE
jgi:hypothetical protein